ncbi:anti-sigma factor family protein [Desulfogranum japonicum]|uniref:anti-sigma factor family protein n=1 Tax=Desulfogranum japonicum TaxID=231447 RepID=UPI00129464BE|nr:zf-HC2 domain-containing protein [Desulfogranum japonicum]
MTQKKSTLPKKRQSDKTLALLALANKQPKAADACLQHEQLAAFVEGRLSNEQSACVLNHLASCDDCYSEWMSLHKTHQEDKQNKPVARLLQFMGKPKSLTTAGSLLAAAACLVLYLNISEKNTPLTMGTGFRPLEAPPSSQLAPPAPVNKEKSSKKIAAPAADDMVQQEIEEQISPAIELNRQRETPHSLNNFSSGESAVDEQFSDGASSPQSSARRVAPGFKAVPEKQSIESRYGENSHRSKAEARTNSPNTITLTPQEWLTALRTVCSNGATSSELDELYIQGQTLLLQPQPENQLLIQLLRTLEQTALSPGERCESIMKKLARQ